jgi:two-component system, NtrC family, sensor kinase
MDFAAVAHDLRTPLNAMLGHTHLLGVESLSDTARRRVAIIESQIRRMSRLIDRCMAQSALQTDVTRVDLNATIRTVIAELDVLLRQRDVRIMLSSVEPLPPVPGDRDALHRVLVNVIVNAAESMPAGGLILIRTRTAQMGPASATAAEIEIADTGAGIPAELIPRVFDHGFTTKHSARERGFGLAICQEIFQAHGGRIELSSEQGKGTTARLTLPTGH